MNIKRYGGNNTRLKKRIHTTTLNEAFIVKESMINKFLELLRTPMISKDFFVQCEKASRGINANKKNR